MSNFKTFNNTEEFSKKGLKLDDYESWLISVKNKMISSIVKSRTEQSISQKKLARLLNTTQSVISRIESGTTKNVTLDYLIKILKILGLETKITLEEAA